jgi:hypothetical protein
MRQACNISEAALYGITVRPELKGLCILSLFPALPVKYPPSLMNKLPKATQKAFL